MGYRCNICNKDYKTYQTLWKHNKQYHINNCNTTLMFVNANSKNVNPNVNVCSKSLICEYCNRIFNNRPAKSQHKKVCKEIKPKQKELELLIKKEETNKIKEETKLIKLKIKLANTEKFDGVVTVRKLNKMLQNQITNSTVNSHNQITNNQIVNNIQLVGFGKEEFMDLLTYQQKKSILNAKSGCLEKLIELIHCGAYNQFKNIIVTNNKDNYMYKYDDNKYQFVLSTKSDVLNSLIDYRLCDLEVIYNDFLEDNKISASTKECIEKFINKINYSDEEFTDINGKIHTNYRNYKINEIKVLLFNNNDKILKDVSLLLTANEVPPNDVIV